MVDEEKILLVIGNGFDLAHKLRTKYTDFLECVSEVQKFLEDKRNKVIERIIGNNFKFRKENCVYPHQRSQLQREIDFERKKLHEIDKNNFNAFRKDEKKIKRWRKKIQSSLQSGIFLKARVIKYIYNFGNKWISYFQSVQNDSRRRIGNNWVDFESEIANIIQKFENFILNFEDLPYGTSIKLDRDMSYFVSDYHHCTDKLLIQKDIPDMNWDLKMLTLAFEFYLVEEVKKLEIKPNPTIQSLENVSAVISYNYTNIWNKIYDTDGSIKPYFIHGELGKHNLVLGIGETLSDDLKNKLTVCASFKKFFQSVKYRLGNQYRNIGRDREGKILIWHVVIYGHSLDSTDSDSLQWLLKNRKLNDSEVSIRRITIYYCDEDSYNQQIANVIQIIGKEELIDSVNSGRIVFKLIDNSA